MPEVPSDVKVNISPQAGTPDVRVKNWVKANSTHHSGALSLLFATLGAKEEPRFLRNILEEIGEASGLLSAWRDSGVNTFGIAGLAELIRSNPGLLEVSGARRRTEHLVASAFESKTGHLYLYKLLSARHSYLHTVPSPVTQRRADRFICRSRRWRNTYPWRLFRQGLERRRHRGQECHWLCLRKSAS